MNCPTCGCNGEKLLKALNYALNCLEVMALNMDGEANVLDRWREVREARTDLEREHYGEE